MKKHWGKRISLLVTAILTAGMVWGCGSSGSRGYETSASAGAPMEAPAESANGYNGFADIEEADYEMAESTMESGAPDSKPVSSDGKDVSYEQKLIRTYYYNFETKDFEASMAFIRQNLTKYEGYIESSEIYGSSFPDANLVLRIPTDRVDDFLGEIGSIGEITYQSVSTEDITLTYYDIASRLESLHAQHDRLLELMERAENLADIAQLESQLSNVEYEINSYQSRMNMYDNLVDYTTVHMNLSTVREMTVVENDSFWNKVVKGLRRNTGNLFRDAEDTIIWLITMLPYFLVIGVIAAILLPIIRMIRRKRLACREKKDAEASEEKQK